jgi:4-hydroxybenzoate polyprenyltransferase
MAGVNALLSINRLGRGNGALFLLLSFGALGTQISLLTHLVLALTAALWYNGLNDVWDLEIDRAAYAQSPYRKVLVNGAMSARALWAWFVVLTLASFALLVIDVRASVWCLVLFAAGILSSVVYNLNSKYLKTPSVPKYVLLDVVVGGPFYFYYASLVAAPGGRVDPAVVVTTIGSLLLCGLYGNFLYASKDLSTDARSVRTLPMLLGSTVGDGGTVRHSGASKGYLLLFTTLLVLLCAWAATRGHWFAPVYALRFVVATARFFSGTVTERGHKKTFVRLSNWEMALLLSLYIRMLDPLALAELLLLGALIVLANVAYFHDERAGRALMLRFGKAAVA